MVTNLFLSISLAVALIAVLWIFFLIRHYKNFCKEAAKLTSDDLIRCNEIKSDIIDLDANRKIYFKDLSHKYRKCLYSAINDYKRSVKEKQRKLAYRTKK